LSHAVSIGTDPRTGDPVVKNSASQFGRPLLLPHEVGEIASDEMILFIPDVGTVRAKRKPYFLLPEFRGKYRNNPCVKNHSGGFFGWLFR
jgi:type IV secretory pathway TraG/TraD family ATPase VirD4